jgi:DNA-3-methyladenine glycosylase II
VRAVVRSITLELAPVPPFRLDLTVWALRRRPDNAVDRWDGTTYRRVLVVSGAALEVEVAQTARPEAPRLRVAVRGDPPGPDPSPAVTAALEHLLGLRVDLSAFYAAAAADRRLGGLAARFRGLKPPRFPTTFEALVNAVACQRITLTQGIRVLNRLADARGPAGPVGQPPIHALPGPGDLAGRDPDALRGLGFTRQQARALVEAGEAVLAGSPGLDGLAALDDAAAVARLRGLRGVGRWTAEYVLLRGLGRTHVFPGDDVGARNNLGRWLGLSSALDYDGVRRAVAAWHPYAGLVYFHLLMDRLASRGDLSAQDGIAQEQ